MAHITASRPWGSYEVLAVREGYKVKILYVDPGKSLSPQKHHHRAERWVVARGTAEVTVSDTVQILFEGDMATIHPGDVHRLHNPGKIVLEVVETQLGSYLEEDDIVRMPE